MHDVSCVRYYYAEDARRDKTISRVCRVYYTRRSVRNIKRYDNSIECKGVRVRAVAELAPEFQKNVRSIIIIYVSENAAALLRTIFHIGVARRSE